MSYRINNRITFLHISKTAGTSISHWIKDNHPFEFSNHRHDKWQDLPEAWRDNVFCVVRNPYERAVSFFTFARTVLTSKKRHHGDPKRTKQQLRELDKGFKHFIMNAGKFDIAKAPNRPSHLWYEVPQLNWLPKDLSKITLLRMETLQRDFGEFAGKHDLKGPALPYKNVSAGRSNYRNFYDEETKAEVEKHYGEDIAKLGYEF